MKNLMILNYAPFSCVDCGQEFESREELEEHETKHQNLSEKGDDI
jgi:LYAR-type C2HC zinc finger